VGKDGQFLPGYFNRENQILGARIFISADWLWQGVQVFAGKDEYGRLW